MDNLMSCKTRDDVPIFYGTQGSEPTSNRADIGTSMKYDICFWGDCPDEDRILAWDAQGKVLADAYTSSYAYPRGGRELFCSTERGYGHINECHHQRNRVLNLPRTAVHTPNGDCDWGSAKVWKYHREVIPSVALGLDVNSHPALDLRAAQTTAWHTMQPEFEGRLSLLNAIFELKDFSDLGKHLVGLSNPFEKLAKIFNKLRARPRSRKAPLSPGASANEALNSVASARLLNEMAVKPLIKDVLQIGIQLKEFVDAKQKEFADAGLLDNVRHYSEDFEFFSDLTPVSTYGFHTGNHHHTLFTASLYYTYEYDNREILDAVKQYWGLDMTAEAAWNMIPWSFIWDYVNNVSKTLNIMRHDSHVDLTWTAYTESLLTEQTYGIHIVPDWPYFCGIPVAVDSNIIHGTRLVSGTQSTLYTRTSTTPNWGPVAPRWSWPKQGQWLNLAALLKTLF